jgi:hypothetical protein
MPLVLTGDGAVGPLSASEVGFLDGVTSSVQTQLNGKINLPSYTSWVPTVQNAAGTSNLTLNVDYNLGEASYYRVGSLMYCVIRIRDIRVNKAGIRFTLPIAAASSDYVAGTFLGATAVGAIFLFNTTIATMGVHNGQDTSEYKYGSFWYLAA